MAGISLRLGRTLTIPMHCIPLALVDGKTQHELLQGLAHNRAFSALHLSVEKPIHSLLGHTIVSSLLALRLPAASGVAAAHLMDEDAPTCQFCV
mmetsp:Transcript_14770/g.47832  ORF Transcript_14770/g.47832 Transcript_14770/m.47832 type:complete len:94 (+) Transcript_14770:1395-1676(+)